jgi:23S rRNA (cytidine1920-2'-O)/16S rRNA (cytidine1409-2'-O)-methyltransferase
MTSKRKSIVKLLQERHLADSEQAAKDLVISKLCAADGVIIENPSSQILESAVIKIMEKKERVGRDGLKLEAALDAFNITPAGLVCADLGSSTGGFTEVLLKKGAKKVYAVDTAKGELDWSLRSDDRVIVYEGVNATKIEYFPEPVSLITVDISLVPLKEILPAVDRLLYIGTAIILIKPQYELPVDLVPPGGVISDPHLEETACNAASQEAIRLGFSLTGIIPSPVKGRSGNQEYLMVLLKKNI